MFDRRPIGVLDSGIGGLTVVRALRRVLPQESIIYIGDTARVPYGTRSQAVLERFAEELVDFLLRYEVKAIVVACNTLSTTVLPVLKARVKVPIFDAMTPVIEDLAVIPKSHKVTMFGTARTVQTGLYSKSLPDHEVTEVACPLLVPFVEEGRTRDEIVARLVNEYALQAPKRGVGAVVLACTHFPILTPLFRQAFGPRVRFYDSAVPVAQAVKKAIVGGAIGASGQSSGLLKCFFTDWPVRSEEVASRFLGESLAGAKKVELSPTLRHLIINNQAVTERSWDCSGLTCVILHGWGSASDRWQIFGQALHERGFKVHALDLPGFGGSAEPPENWGLKEYVVFVEQYIKLMAGSKPVLLVGHSFGGQIAMEVAAGSKVPLEALVLFSTAGLRRPPSGRRRVAQLIAKAGKPLKFILRRLGGETLVYKLLGRFSGSYDYANATPRMREVLKRVTRQSSEPILNNIKTPTLLLWAADDTITPLEDGRRLAALIRNAKLRVFPNGGHSFYKRETPALVEAILSFLKKS